MLGYIRPEYDYVSKESLIEDIMKDCDVARKSLDRPAYRRVEAEGESRDWLLDFNWVSKMGGIEALGGDDEKGERLRDGALADKL